MNGAICLQQVGDTAAAPGMGFIVGSGIPDEAKKFVEIIDASGKLVVHKQCINCSEIETLELVEQGPYYVRFKTDKGSFTKKIMKF